VFVNKNYIKAKLAFKEKEEYPLHGLSVSMVSYDSILLVKAQQPWCKSVTNEDLLFDLIHVSMKEAKITSQIHVMGFIPCNLNLNIEKTHSTSLHRIESGSKRN
jgi:hypothetical protein